RSYGGPFGQVEAKVYGRPGAGGENSRIRVSWLPVRPQVAQVASGREFKPALDLDGFGANGTNEPVELLRDERLYFDGEFRFLIEWITDDERKVDHSARVRCDIRKIMLRPVSIETRQRTK